MSFKYKPSKIKSLPKQERPSSYSVKDLGILSVALIFILLLLVLLSPALFILLVISFLVTRLLQFIRYGDAYDYVIQLKCFIRIGICFIGILFTGFIKLVFTYTSFNLNNIDYSVKFLGFPILIWLEIPYKIISLFFWSLILSFTYIIIPVVPLDLKGSGRNVPEAVHELAVSLLALLWPNLFTFLEIVKPNCEIQNILGLCTREWIKLPFFALTTYNVITLSTHMTVWLLPKLVPLKHRLHFLRNSIFEIIARKFLVTENQVYWVNGTKHCISFIFTSLMFLLTWVLYFGPLLNETIEGEKLLEFGIWTCFSLIICAILWFMKTVVILLWEAGSVYNRLNHKIIQGGKQLYFLGVMGRDKYDIFNLLCDKIQKKEHEKSQSIFENYLISSFALIIFYPVLATNPYSFYHGRFDNMGELGHGNKVCSKRKKRVKDDLIMQDFDQSKYSTQRKRPLFSTMHGLQKVAQYLLSAKKALAKEKYISDILQNVTQNDVIVNGDITRKLKELFGEDDCYEFTRQLADDEYDVKKIEMWMEKARNNCLLLGNTLSSAKEVVDCLNITISSLIIFATFIMWLLLTGLATTKLVASITTPILALTFIFKNTCKTLFEGIIFAYVVHPFSVGDLCIIDGTMMEVTTVGLWKTTFSKIGTQEEVIYPNSELSSKCIINHKTDFDWNDYVEFRVNSLRNNEITNLKQRIEEYLRDNKDKFTPNYNSVEILMSGENFTINVNFRHNVNLKNKSYFECLKEKRKLRSELILELQQRKMKYQMSQEYSIEELCGCDYEVEINKDWSDIDPGRVYVACPFYLDERVGCGYFRWIAPEGTKLQRD